MLKETPHSTDIGVGRNVRIRRIAKRISQTELGERIGVTFQQVQKYESGANRIGASRLMQISEVLETSIQSLFAGVADEDGQETDSPSKLISDPQALRLVQAFAKIDDANQRRAIVALAERIASNGVQSSGT